MFRPLGNRVVIKLDAAATQTKSGILIPDAAQNKPQVGTVLAVGAGARVNGEIVPMSVKVNDKVMISKFTGTELKLADQTVLIVPETDILGIV